MSFGQKPAAWARPSGAQNQQLNQSLLANQLGLAAGQPFAGMPAMSLNSSINALVNQAAFTNMNSVLAQAQAAQQRLLPQNVTAQQQSRPAPTQSPPSRNQRTFVGTVTKLMETYGFVDEDVFFQTNVIRGSMPRVGDRVMVDASFNPSMPFKWNAYRIQLPTSQETPSATNQNSNHHQQHSSRPALQQQTQPSYQSNNVPQRWQNERREEPQRHQPENNRVPYRHRNEVRRSPRRSPIRKAKKREREKSPVRESREVTRTRSPALSVAASSKRDADSPPHRRQRVLPRYRCYKPKMLPYSGAMVYQELHKRYTNLYIPSDFIKCEFDWLNSVQLDAPMKFSPHSVVYSVLHKDIDMPATDNSVPLTENPADADNRYIVKVLLLSHPGLVALRQKMHGLLPDGSIDENAETHSILKNLQFLVGIKNKNEYTCIGGAWSPSLDGENALDPQTQINTAIRTTRTLVGVDLSTCSKWYKMVHLYYYRAERNRVDNVILMLPDTSATACLMPNEEEFKKLEENLKIQLADKLAAIDSEQFVSSTASMSSTNLAAGAGDNESDEKEVNLSSTTASVTDFLSTSKKSNETVPTSIENNPQQQLTSESRSVDNNAENSTATGEVQQAANTPVGAAMPSEKTPGSENAGGTMTPQSIKSMKVVELREELEKRGLDSKGVKNVLLQRLQEALDKEGKSGNAGDMPESISIGKSSLINVKKEILEPMEIETTEQKLATEEAKAERLEKEKKVLEKAIEKFEKEKKERKAALQRHFVLPKEPSVFVYPNKHAKSGKFDCKVVSLDSLLDYHVDDCKESAFEVFVFAEALREALDRSNGFLVYRALECGEERSVERDRREKALSDAANENSDEVIIIEEESSDKKKKKDEKKTDYRHSFKALVHDADTFSAFAYFDENVSSYIEDRDLEDILFSIGLGISRSEVQKLVKKLSNRDRCNYRNITDKWVDAEGNVKYTATLSENCKSASELARGHCSESVSKSTENVSLGSTPDVTDKGVVFYKGSVLNIAKALEQHNVVEKELAAALVKNDEFDMQLKSVKKQRDQLEKNKKRLESDVDRYKKKLYQAEKCLKAAQEGSASFKTALQDCKKFATRIQTTIDKAIPQPVPAAKKVDKKKESDNDEDKNELENGDVEIVLTEEVGNEDSEKKVGDDAVEMEDKDADVVENEANDLVETDKAVEEKDEAKEKSKINGNSNETVEGKNDAEVLPSTSGS